MSKAHHVDSKLLKTNALMSRMVMEADDQPFKAVVTQRNGEQAWTGSGEVPVLSQRMLGFDLAKKLNQELNYDGVWIVQWVKPQSVSVLLLDGCMYTEMRLMWLDGDGDWQFTVEVNDSIAEIIAAGWIHWAEQCEEAWQRWKYHNRDILELTSKQTYKAAQGEKPCSIN